ncbi:MAG: hypothetical protein HUJ60_04865, partial [Bacilli bacterium]|nr:hypothetical protein [Bacilli bacterium]
LPEIETKPIDENDIAADAYAHRGKIPLDFMAYTFKRFARGEIAYDLFQELWDKGTIRWGRFFGIDPIHVFEREAWIRDYRMSEEPVTMLDYEEEVLSLDFNREGEPIWENDYRFLRVDFLYGYINADTFLRIAECPQEYEDEEELRYAVFTSYLFAEQIEALKSGKEKQ